jgi:hypothetical protein
MITSQENLHKMIKTAGNRFFTVEFLKKDGTIRRMNCRTGVKKHLANNGKGTSKLRPVTPGLVTVYDVQSKGYRSFYINRLISLTIDGVTYRPTYTPAS